MHIQRIVIKNFRNFEHLELADLPPASVIVGENSTGKSNLLHALRLVLDPSLPDTARRLIAEDFWDGLGGPFDGQEICVSVEIADFDGDAEAYSLLDEHCISSSPSVAQLTYLFRPRAGAPDETVEAGYEYVIIGGAGRPVSRDVANFISLRVLPALRDAESLLSSARSPLRQLLARIVIDPAQLDEASEAVIAAGDALLADVGVASVNTGITDRMKSMVGDTFSVATSLGFASSEPDQLLRAIRLLVDEAKQRTVSQSSLGTANLIYLALLLEQISAQQVAREIVTTILAVEEPEAHLHPHLQRVLFRHLLAEQRPLLVTTHSPHLVSVAPLRAISVLRACDGGTVANHARDLDFGAGEEADLERYLDITRSEMVFAKGVILVEGTAEQFLVPAFASAIGVDLDAHGISVCSVAGTDFGPYVRLLSAEGLDIPHVVITDGDPNSDGDLVGIGRCVDLLDDSEIERVVDDALEEDDLDEALTLLASHGMFVGSSTLELDLLPAGRDAMLQAYRELGRTDTQCQNFADNIDDLLVDDADAAGKIMRRITKIGKGRYAQRLAAHSASFPPPDYVAAAIRKIESLVSS